MVLAEPIVTSLGAACLDLTLIVIVITTDSFWFSFLIPIPINQTLSKLGVVLSTKTSGNLSGQPTDYAFKVGLIPNNWFDPNSMNVHRAPFVHAIVAVT